MLNLLSGEQSFADTCSKQRHQLFTMEMAEVQQFFIYFHHMDYDLEQWMKIQKKGEKSKDG